MFIDLRTLMPWTGKRSSLSRARTRRCLIVHEDLQRRFRAEIAAAVADEAFIDLDAPISRLTMPGYPSPHNPVCSIGRFHRRNAYARRLTGPSGSSEMGDLIDIQAPLEQEGTKAVVRNWLRKIGETVKSGIRLVELETDKVTQEVSAPADGLLAEILMRNGDDAPPGAVLGRIGSEAAGAGHAPQYSPAVAACSGRIWPGSGHRHRHRPGWPRQRPTWTGRLRPGRKALLRSRAEAGDRGAAPKSRRIPHSAMRAAIAEHMLTSVTTAPHVTAVFEADFSAVMRHPGRTWEEACR